MLRASCGCCVASGQLVRKGNTDRIDWGRGLLQLPLNFHLALPSSCGVLPPAPRLVPLGRVAQEVGVQETDDGGWARCCFPLGLTRAGEAAEGNCIDHQQQHGSQTNKMVRLCKSALIVFALLIMFLLLF